MSYSRTPAMRTSMHWMGEMMGCESSKQFWLWLLLFWRILGRHCYLFESHVFSPYTSITCFIFMQERTMGKWLQKCPPNTSKNSSLKNVMCISKISLKLVNKVIWAFLDQWWCFIVISGESLKVEATKEHEREQQRKTEKKKKEAFKAE